MRVSFVIPMRNEEAHIGGLIDSIRAHAQAVEPYELIAVDNGSSDRSTTIARDRGAVVIDMPAGTIGALRNRGVASSSGNVIVFLDADVCLGTGWGRHIHETTRLLKVNSCLITGSICDIQDPTNWIERNWFRPRVLRRDVAYLNSGHLIVSREFFDKLGGFREELETGEDDEFCRRAARAGARMLNEPLLHVVHYGYPKTILEFFRRERWHGRGDFISWRRLRSSKPALLSLLEAGFLVGGLAGSALFGALRYAAAGLALAAALPFGAAIVRCRSAIRSLPACTVLYAVYFVARALAGFDVLMKRFRAGRLEAA